MNNYYLFKMRLPNTSKVIRKISIFFNIFKYKITRLIKKNGYIAHHGLQRNGTNYLLLILKRCKFSVINDINVKRNDPRHKHFRWYLDKGLIPNAIFNQFHNQLNVKNIHELNAVCAYPEDTKHIVIYKKPNSSLVSILNWGMRVGWFDTKEDAIKEAHNFINDYKNYLNFWSNLSDMDPDFVQLMSYERLLDSKSELKKIIFNLKLNKSIKKLDLSFDEVPQSPKSRINPIKFDDIDI